MVLFLAAFCQGTIVASVKNVDTVAVLELQHLTLLVLLKVHLNCCAKCPHTVNDFVKDVGS